MLLPFLSLGEATLAVCVYNTSSDIGRGCCRRAQWSASTSAKCKHTPLSLPQQTQWKYIWMVHKSNKAFPLCEGSKCSLCQTEADYYTSAGGDKSSQITTSVAAATFQWKEEVWRRRRQHQRSRRAEMGRWFLSIHWSTCAVLSEKLT